MLPITLPVYKSLLPVVTDAGEKEDIFMVLGEKSNNQASGLPSSPKNSTHKLNSIVAPPLGLTVVLVIDTEAWWHAYPFCTNPKTHNKIQVNICLMTIVFIIDKIKLKKGSTYQVNA